MEKFITNILFNGYSLYKKEQKKELQKQNSIFQLHLSKAKFISWTENHQMKVRLTSTGSAPGIRILSTLSPLTNANNSSGKPIRLSIVVWDTETRFLQENTYSSIYVLVLIDRFKILIKHNTSTKSIGTHKYAYQYIRIHIYILHKMAKLMNEFLKMDMQTTNSVN